MHRWPFAVGVQALGSAASLLGVLLVTRFAGLEAQGQFGLLKSWTDALTAVALLGLPQALLHWSYHGGAVAARLRRFAERYAAAVLVLAAVGAVVAAVAGRWTWLPWALLAVPPLVLHALLRSLLLEQAGALAYAQLTAAPALLLLAALAAFTAAGRHSYGPALLLAALLAAATAHVFASRVGLPRESGPAGVRWRGINAHACTQNVLAALQPALLLSLPGLYGASAAALGAASFSLVFLQLSAALAAYLAPLIYDRIARDGGSASALPVPASLRSRWPWALLALAAAVALLGPVLRAFVPAPTAALVPASQLMLGAGALLLANRLLATILQARGAFTELTLQALWRLGASVALAGVGLGILQWPAALVLALALLLTEAVLLVRALHAWRRLTGPGAAASPSAAPARRPPPGEVQ